ncbi:MAG TPA: MFS transporter [Kiloniellales bacterium]|nr:MFS transporter [Kiloniellales bacterium]
MAEQSGATPSTSRRDAKILALIGTGHGLSHFYLLALPPLFPLLKEEFGVSYAALGLLITVINVATAAAQVPAGVLIDRIGAKGVLMGGLVVMGLAMGLIGLAHDYWLVLALVTIAGLGNSVFHPADYVILSSSVDQTRLGRAYSIHTFTGNVGFAAAPATMIALTALLGWRGALIVAGFFAVAALVAFLLSGDLLHDEARVARNTAEKSKGRGSLRPLLGLPVVMLFLFFVTASMVTAGVQSFSVAALDGFHAIGLTSANSVLTAFLVSSALGVLLGGVIADRTRRHGLVATVSMVVAAVLFVLLGIAPLSVPLLILLFTAIGLLLGSIRPARDMMVKAATPPGATGRVFGFVSTGLNVGSALTPALFGLILDFGEPRLVFFLLGVFVLLGVGTIGVVRGPARLRRPEQVPAE